MNKYRSYQAVYSLIYFFLFAALAALNPFFPIVLQFKGYSPSQVGLIMGSYEFFSITGLLVIGHFYDRIQSPRRTVLFIGLICMTILFFIVGTQNRILLILLTLGFGFFIKSPSSLVDAHYGQIMPDSPNSYGKARLYGSLGFFFAALSIQMTGWVEGTRPESVFGAYAILLLIAIFFLMRLPAAPLTEIHHDSVSFMKSIKSFPRVYWIGLSLAFLSFLGMSGHYTFFSLLLKNKFETENIGGFWAIGPLFEIPLFFFSGWLLRNVGIKKLWMISLISGMIRMQVYSLSNTLFPLYLVQILHSFSFGLNHLAVITLISKTTSKESRGMAMSLYSAIGMGFSLFVGGFLGGWILGFSNYRVLFQFFSVFPLMGVFINFMFLKWSDPALQE
jgi:PPP family 3-phenylpropionic acid transporter